MKLPTDFTPRLGFWSFLLLSALAWGPGLHPGYWEAAAGYVPAFNAAEPAALAHVATSPDLWRGMGIGAVAPAHPLMLLGVAPWLAVKIVLLTTILLSGMAVYAWLAPRLGDRAAGLAAFVYGFSPIVLTTVYVQGNLSHAMLLVLFPMALAGVAAWGVQRSMLGAGIAVLSILWMVRTQAGLAVLAMVALLLYAWLVERSWSAILIVLVSGLAGLVSLAPLWSQSAEASGEFAAHFVSAYGLLHTGILRAQPVQLGVAALVLAVVALWGLWMAEPAPESEVRRLVLFCVALSFVLCLFAMAWSEPLWSLLQGGRFVSYPWQILLPTAALLAAAAGSVVVVFPELERSAYWSALIVTVILAGQPYIEPRTTQVTPGLEPRAIVGSDALAILEARVTEAVDGGSAEVLLTWQALRPMDVDANLFVHAVGAGEESPVVAQFDGQPVEDRPATSWMPGEIFTGLWTLDLSDASLPVDHFELGFYDWRDGARLAVDGGIADKIPLYAGANDD